MPKVGEGGVDGPETEALAEAERDSRDEVCLEREAERDENSVVGLAGVEDPHHAASPSTRTLVLLLRECSRSSLCIAIEKFGPVTLRSAFCAPVA